MTCFILRMVCQNILLSMMLFLIGSEGLINVKSTLWIVVFLDYKDVLLNAFWPDYLYMTFIFYLNSVLLFCVIITVHICCCCLVPKPCPTVSWHHGLCLPIPLSVGFLRHDHWRGLLFLSPGDLPDPGIEPMSPTLQADS